LFHLNREDNEPALALRRIRCVSEILQTIYIENNFKLFRNSQYYFELWKKSKLFSIGLNSSKLSGDVRFAIYTRLNQEMMQATAEDPADVFKTVDAAARKKQMQKPASKVLWLPRTGG